MFPSRKNKIYEQKPDKKTFEIASRVHVQCVCVSCVCVCVRVHVFSCTLSYIANIIFSAGKIFSGLYNEL